MRRHFLVDASALVPFFTNPTERPVARQSILKLLSLRAEQKAVLLIPNFCMAECSKALARAYHMRIKSHERAAGEYQKAMDRLLEMVSSSRQGLIQSYALSREHLVGIEDIFNAEWAMGPRGSELSGLDGLFLAMGRKLMRDHGADNVRIVTGDRWMAEVCKRNPELLPSAIYIYKDLIPDG